MSATDRRRADTTDGRRADGRATPTGSADTVAWAAGGASAGAFGRRARSSGRGAGGAARKLPYLGILCVRSPEIFFAKGGLCRAGIVAVCVFPQKNIRPPRVRPFCRHVPRGKRLPTRREKKYVPAPQGVSQEHGAGNAARKKQPAPEKNTAFYEKKTPVI